MNDAVTKRPPALGPLARQLSRNVADTIGSAVPKPPRTLNTRVIRVGNPGECTPIIRFCSH
jgi:hypothetical protein